MINKDFKRFDSKKSLFSGKNSSRKQSFRKPLAFSAISAVCIIALVNHFNTDSVIGSPSVKALPLYIQAADTRETTQIDGQEISLPVNNETTRERQVANLKLADSKPVAEIDFLKPLAPLIPPVEWQAIKVKKNDTLAKIFNNRGYSATDLHYLMKSGDDIKVLKKIRPGHTIEFVKSDDPNTGFESLRYPYSLSETLVINKVANKSFETSIEKKPITFKKRFATGKITSSFYNAGLEASLPDGVIMELAGVFEYDIDFALEIRQGDSFSVLYQEKFIDGVKSGYGDILSADFSNQGDQYAAVQYTNAKGRTAYYTPDGKALRKSFLRAPLKFNYVSSRFNPKRFHPIQKRVKPHRGVDYRAATGTPVRTSGDGRVVRASYDRFNGHHVFIQHGNNIVTKYLHFSKRKVKKGQRVKQGQIIGYVGSTGMSQAPHLHYEFVVNGVHRNPRTVKLPHAAPVKKGELARFKEQTKDLLTQLETERVEHFARLNINPETTKLKQ